MKKKLNIAVVVAEFPTVSETFVINQIVYLIHSGHDVTILSFLKPKENVKHSIIEEYKLLDKCIYLTENNRSIFKRYINYIKWLIKTPNLKFSKVFKSLNIFKSPKEIINLSFPYLAQWFVTDKEFDIVHIHFATNATGISEMMHKNLIDKSKLFISFHGYDIVPKNIEKYKIKYQYILTESHSLIANSLYTKNLIDKLGVPDKTKVIPVSLNTNFFKPEKSESKIDSTFRIIFCGRLIKLKGPELLISIINEMVNIRNHKNIELLIIGLGECLADVELKIREYNLSNYINILGNKSQDEIKKLMDISNVLIQPGITDPYSGREETQGLVIQEAQSMGLPVLVSDVGGMKYGLKNGITGFVVEQNNIIQFADKLEFFINNPELTIEMGMKAREFVIENFDSEILGKKLEQLYFE